ncbi:hypothetical protein [Synechococcus sp. W60.1]|uniref:hypothetical protein n=1 Tax=Synechococcus sp. W60.1 TaxID=2964516 RepID=UPI0039C1B518
MHMVKVSMAADYRIRDPWQSLKEGRSGQPAIEKQTVGSHLQPIGTALLPGIRTQGEQSKGGSL